jgi:hypothetical protein
MQSYKKFYISVVLLLLAFVLVNALIWKTVTENMLSGKNYQGGDLARMGYIHGSKDLRKNVCDLPVRHLELSEYSGQKIDVLAMGDSFSNGGGGGRNRYYQDYIATINNCTVLNLVPFKEIDSISALSIYANNGYLDKIKPKYIIIESSEKICIENLAHAVDFALATPITEMDKQKRMEYNQTLPEVSFINEGNFKFLFYTVLYNFSDHAFLSKVYVKELTRPFFSAKNANKLVFLRDDIRKIPLATEKWVKVLNDNINTLADKLRAKGIKLYFMPCVDKYDLYSDYIVNNQYPKSTLFGQLRELPKRYEFIDTKAILAEELKKGEKDIFYADDTHWSWKASQKIFETVRFQ